MRRNSGSIRFAKARLGFTSFPVTCMSMGEGSPKLKNLGDDVRRQKIEDRSGKFARELLAELTYVIVGGMMFRFQRNQNVGVGGPDLSRIAVRQIDLAIGQADIVENRVELRRGISRRMIASITIAQTGRFLDAGAGLARTCSLNWPVSVLGKKSWPSTGISETRKIHANKNSGTKIFAGVDQGRQDSLVSGPQAFEARSKAR